MNLILIIFLIMGYGFLITGFVIKRKRNKMLMEDPIPVEKIKRYTEMYLHFMAYSLIMFITILYFLFK